MDKEIQKKDEESFLKYNKLIKSMFKASKILSKHTQ